LKNHQSNSPPQAQSAQPSSPPQQQPSQTADISMTLLNQLMEICATLTQKVANLEQDKIAQALEITKLKQRVRRLEKKRRTKNLRLKILRKVGTTQRVESSINTGVDDQEDASKQGEIAELDADEDVTLEDVDAEFAMDANIQGRMEESQAKAYNLDLQHAEKVLSMHDTDEPEPAEVEEVLEVVTTAKLITEVVVTVVPIITDAQVPKHSTPRKRRGVVIQDPEEIATASVIVHSDARKNMIIYLKNMAGFKMDFFKGEEEVTVQEEGSKRKGENLKQDTAKKQMIDKQAEELKTYLQIVANDDDDVYTEATPLASKNFDREDLEVLWKLVKERFESAEPKNFSDDFLLNTLKIMYEKPNVEASVWRDHKGRYGLEKPLTHFTLEQILNNVRLEVEEESEMSLELLRVLRALLLHCSSINNSILTVAVVAIIAILHHRSTGSIPPPQPTPKPPPSSSQPPSAPPHLHHATTSSPRHHHIFTTQPSSTPPSSMPPPSSSPSPLQPYHLYHHLHATTFIIAAATTSTPPPHHHHSRPPHRHPYQPTTQPPKPPPLHLFF
nr:hypothetical protein [Tanacetum cinerariifolium]